MNSLQDARNYEEKKSMPYKYASCQMQLVSINPETRRPAPLPESFKKIFNSQPEAFQLRITPLKIHEHHFVYSLQVQPSDTDLLRHVNQSVYLRYCFDAAQVATSEGFFVNFSGDLFGKEVADADMLYQGEGRAGEHLRVLVWEGFSEANKDTTVNKSTKAKLSSEFLMFGFSISFHR